VSEKRACSAGCYPCYSGGFAETGQHQGCCCGGGACGGQKDAYDSEKAEQLERQKIIEKMLIAASTASLMIEANKQRDEQNVRDELLRLARKEEAQLEAEEVQERLEARVQALRDRQREKAEQVEKERQEEETVRAQPQGPKVVHVKAPDAAPARVRQEHKVMNH